MAVRAAMPLLPIPRLRHDRRRAAKRRPCGAKRSSRACGSSPGFRESRPARERIQPDRQLRQRQAEPRREQPKNVQRSEERTRQRAEQQQRQRTQRADQQRQRAEQQRQVEQRRLDQRKEQSKTTQGPKPDMGKGQEGIRQDVKRVQANDEQRIRVRDRLFKEGSADRKRWDRERIRDRGVRPIVGFHIPRRHHLHRLPLWVVDYAPIYRDYSYVVIEDTICIVDPATYVVVDVLPASSQRADIRELSLTSDEMRFVYTEVPKDTSVDVRIRLALGAEIPRNVALYTFPDHVLDRIPKLANYRYVVVGNDVAIVDPADYAVVLVIPG